MKQFIKKIIFLLIDLFLIPFIFIVGFGFKYMKDKGLGNFQFTFKILKKLEIGFIRNHYYDPIFLESQIDFNYEKPRELIGIEWNVSGQLELISRFNFNQELIELPKKFENTKTFYIDNPAFGSGDADFLYQLIRTINPKIIVEIGSGHSTLLTQKALEMNMNENSSIEIKHICIEPYEKPWLSELNIELHRKKVEEMPMSIFEELKSNDILFIDSSHIIRPQGDVLFEIQHIFPKLKSGVIVHIHDIFSPHHYPKEWIVNEHRLWNEQYLLEVFLTNNPEWKIIGALNYLKHFQYDLLQEKCPLMTIDREPGSFYIQKL